MYYLLKLYMSVPLYAYSNLMRMLYVLFFIPTTSLLEEARNSKCL